MDPVNVIGFFELIVSGLQIFMTLVSQSMPIASFSEAPADVSEEGRKLACPADSLCQVFC